MRSSSKHQAEIVLNGEEEGMVPRDRMPAWDLDLTPAELSLGIPEEFVEFFVDDGFVGVFGIDCPATADENLVVDDGAAMVVQSWEILVLFRFHLLQSVFIDVVFVKVIHGILLIIFPSKQIDLSID